MAAQRKALTREPVIGQNLFNPVTLWRQGRGIISQPTGRQRQKNYSGDEQPPQLNQAARAVIIAVLAPATHLLPLSPPVGNGPFDWQQPAKSCTC
jgi:hypothetical protein